MSFLSYLRRLRTQIQGEFSRRSKRRPSKGSRGVRPTFDSLEDRTLMAVAPAPVVDVDSQLALGGNNNPSVARDPLDPNRLVMVSSTGGALAGRYSVNGGADWFTFDVGVNDFQGLNGSATPVGPTGGNFQDPTNALGTGVVYAQATSPSVAFDRHGHFYVVHTQHNAARTSGALIFEKYSFQAASLTGNLVPDEDIFAEKILSQWVGADPVLNPVIGIDTNVPFFRDPDTGATQADIFSDQIIYVAWNTNNTAPTGNFTLGNAFTPSTIKLIASPDDGDNWTSEVYVNDGGTTSGGTINAFPQIVFPQGTISDRPLHPQAGAEGVDDVPGGQLTVAWSRGTGVVVDSNRDFNNQLQSQLAPATFLRDDNPIAVYRSNLPPSFPIMGVAGGNFLGDAVIPASGDHLPVETIFAIDVDLTDPNFDLLADLEVQLGLVNTHMNQVQIVLRSPGGQQVMLLDNRMDAAGNTPANNPPGLPDVDNLGVFSDQNNNRYLAVGTIFDQQAPRPIVDGSAVAPFMSHFRPESGGLDSGGLNNFNGFHLDQTDPADTDFVNGTWYLRITDFRNSNENPKPLQFLDHWGLRFTSGLNTTELGSDNPTGVLANTVAVASPFPQPIEVPAVAAGRGIGPGMSIAVDNTLGSFSPFQGRMYMVYTTPFTVLINNVSTVVDTDIAISTSDDGGVSWTDRGVINDDNPPSNFVELARYQFMPSITVDQATGTVIATWYDARNDASRARVATYMATSIDGGVTWSDQVFLNAARTSTDAITGEKVDLEPIPTSSLGAGAFGYGEHLAVTAHGGRVNAFWVGNDNQSFETVVGGNSIRTASVHIAAGPRIVASDMGPVVNGSTYTNPRTGEITPYNNLLAADGPNVSAGTRQLDGFLVTFDRPIDPNTFTPADVVIHFRAPNTPANAPPTAIIAATDVIPLNDGTLFGPARVGDVADNPNVRVLATDFLVRFDPQGRVGTYSYAIGPDIQDRIRTAPGAFVVEEFGPNSTVLTIDSTDVPQPILDFTTSVSTITVAPGTFPLNEVVRDINVTLSLTHTFVGDLRITLTGPDNQTIVLTNQNGGGGNNFTNTTFDDEAPVSIFGGTAPYTGSFRPEEMLSQFNLIDPTGDWTLTIDDLAFVDEGALTDWSITFTTGLIVPPQTFNSSDTPVSLDPPVVGQPNTVESVITVAPNAFPAGNVVADINVNLSLVYPEDDDLIISLISPTGQQVILSNSRGGLGMDYTDTTFDDSALAGIAAGTAPFTGTFRPDQPLGFFIGANFAGDWTLRIEDINGAHSGISQELTNWSLEMRTGTLVSSASLAVVPDGNYVRYTAGGAQVPKDIPDLAGTTPSPSNPNPPPAVTSTITLPAGLDPLADIRVNLNIGHTETSQLIVTLTSPGLTEITLFNGPASTLTPGDYSIFGLSDDNFVNTRFDDFVYPRIDPSPSSITTGFAPFTGSFRPELIDTKGAVNSLGKLRGEDPSGVWTLTIIDTASGEFGDLLGWSLEVLGSEEAPTDQISRGNYMDQDADGRTKEEQGIIDPNSPNPYPFNVIEETSGDIYSVPEPVNGTPLLLPYTNDTLPLIVPGPHLAPPPIFTKNEVTGANPNGLRLPAPGPNPPPNENTGGSSTPFDTVESNLTVGGIPQDHQIVDVNVQVAIQHFRASDLVVTLIAPDGTEVPLALHEPFKLATGVNYSNTVFDDQATDDIFNAAAPFIGSFRPDGRISETDLTRTRLDILNGKAANGQWTLRIQDIAGGQTILLDGLGDQILDANGQTQIVDTIGFLKSWSLTIDTARVVLNNPSNSVDIVFDRDMDPNSFTAADIQRIVGPAGNIPLFDSNNNPLVTVTSVNARTFRVNFPLQNLGGTYTVVYGPDVRSARGEQLDINLNAGVYQLRGRDPNNTTTSNVVTTSNLDVAISANATIQAKINVTDAFQLRSLLVSLNVDNFGGLNSGDLIGKLFSPDGTEVVLFNRPGSSGGSTIFNDVVFDDLATTPIANFPGSPTNVYNPQTPLSNLIGEGSAGIWTLQIQNVGSGTGRLDGWSLTQRKSVPGTGLGESLADQATAHFRIFTVDPNNALSQQVWTAVGPASLNTNSNAGRVTAIAVDSSDPSGNTVYIGTPAGGIWKSTNFLTTESTGPTWQPLTDFGTTHGGLHISSIALFPVKNPNTNLFDPRLTMIFATTGEGQARTIVTTEGGDAARGVGFLRSMDGGLTWALLDSRDNTQPFAGGRDHAFVGTASYKIVADPTLNPANNRVILYAAVSDHLNTTANMGGIWRSLDSGDHWTRLNLAGQGSDVILDQTSRSQTTGNLQSLFVSIQGTGGGVYRSINQGNSFILMAGTTGSNPVVKDADFINLPSLPVVAPTSTPTGQGGRIVLARPPLTDNPVHNLLYSNWLYAAVSTPGLGLQGLYVTKDLGANWTLIRLPEARTRNGGRLGVQTNNETNGFPDFDPIFSGGQAMTLVVDPTNPNVVYLGGRELIRVDTTGLNDAQNLTAYDHSDAPFDSDGDGSVLDNYEAETDGSVRVKPPNPQPPAPVGPILTNGGDNGLLFDDSNPILDWNPVLFDFISRSFFNLIKDPNDIFGSDAILYTTNLVRFNNNGTDAHWTSMTGIQQPNPFDPTSPFTSGLTHMVSMIDPVTGLSRLIFGDAQGVYTAVDGGDGQLSMGIGSATTINGTRNGNLQIAQFYQGAAQPSQLAAEVAGALFFGTSLDNGAHPQSRGDILNTGYLGWDTPYGDFFDTGDVYGDATGVETDQTGSGTQYHYVWPFDLQDNERFFQVTKPGSPPIVRVGTGAGSLIRFDNDPQWPTIPGLRFAVNPINGQHIAIGSNQGRVYRTRNEGQFWELIADQGTLDGTYPQAVAYGAPDPLSPFLNNDDFLWAGTVSGNVFVTLDGGGSWVDLDPTGANLDGSDVVKIVTNPTRGSHEAYVTTQSGVYHVQFDVNYSAGGGNVVSNIVWSDITGGLFNLTHGIFGNSNQIENILAPNSLTSLAVDWRVRTLDDPNNPSGPSHPTLYVSGIGGVFRAREFNRAAGTATWTYFPNVTDDDAPVNGGYLPLANVTDLDLSVGNIDPTTGNPIQGGGANILVATTFGRGTFAIRLTNDGSDGNRVSGPRIIDDFTGPASPVGPGFSEITVEFDGPVDPTTFDFNDIQLSGPNGGIAIIDIEDVTPAPVPGNLNPGSQFRIVFAAQSTSGTYTVRIGPNVLDFSGRAMDQDQDLSNGESNDDVYTHSWELVGLRVNSISPSGTISQSPGLQFIDVEFSLPVDVDPITPELDFTSADVTITGPNGVVPILGQPVSLDGGVGRRWRINLVTTQTTVGTYVVQIGPGIQSTAATGSIPLGGVFTDTITIQGPGGGGGGGGGGDGGGVIPAEEALNVVAFLAGPLRKKRNGLFTQRITLFNNGSQTVTGRFTIILANLTKGARLTRPGPDGFVLTTGKGRRSRRSPYRIVVLNNGQLRGFSGQDVVLQIRFLGRGKPKFTRIIVPGVPG